MEQTTQEGERRAIEIKISVEELFRQFLSELGQLLLDHQITLEEFVEQGLSLLTIDRTTGTFNKHGIEAALGTAMAVARKENIPLTVLFVDGDDFKIINDNINHDAGDKAILGMLTGIQRAAGRRLDIRTRLKEGESMQEGRQGGDEFVVILLGTNIYGATRVAENVQREIGLAVAGIVPEYEKKFHHPFTASVGMAEFNPLEDQSAADLLKRADQHLMRVRDEMGKTKRT